MQDILSLPQEITTITATNLQKDLCPEAEFGSRHVKWTPQFLSSYHHEDKSLVQQLADLLQSELDGICQGDLDGSDMNLEVYQRRCWHSLRYFSIYYEILPSSLFIQDVQKDGRTAIAGGGFSDIWRGITTSNQFVCIKVLRLTLEQFEEEREKIRKRFSTEALVWRQLRHPNILPLLGVNDQLFEPSFCLISPWMENRDIITYLKRNETHNRHDVFSEVAAGLSYLHSRAPPFVHGDIRGGNVLVTADSKCVLADFGLSVAYSESQIWSKTTMTNEKGTLRWMAPEILNPDESDNPALRRPSADVYAFGSTVVEVI
ncbi:hypothetical protein GYMLUDRAFT_403232 [Collybiopsis luxurians FD-317 M1]|nr:hypothetical protein GYMLUDRAFT_403232 [Collybiopsis luxurians FD-317 M1]